MVILSGWAVPRLYLLVLGAVAAGPGLQRVPEAGIFTRTVKPLFFYILGTNYSYGVYRTTEGGRKSIISWTSAGAVARQK